MIRRRPTRLEFALFVCVPAIWTIVAISIFRSIHSFAGDFAKEFWPAGLHLIHGQTPYLLSHAQVADGLAFPYPALSAVLFAPFALLARNTSEIVFTVICFLALFGTLRVLRVRDWRLYGIVLLWGPVLNAWQSANLTLLLGLGIALIWRYRDRALVAGACAAVIVSLKLFVWPVALWLLATRRYRAALAGLGWGLLVNAAAWAVVGYGQIGRFLEDAGRVSGVFFRSAYTPVALVLHLGVATPAADAIGALAGLAVALACFSLGRRGDDRGALTLAVALMWLASPVLWMHYFALALIPLAISRPRLSLVCAGPIVLIICGSRSSSAWQIVLTMIVMGTLLAAALRESLPPPDQLRRRPAGAASSGAPMIRTT